ncbi:MAG: mannose-1-phosphate guanylyltransferase [Phycisphaerae bacterium]|nr:mannose-1-phosphate guanylyltransferase [Phycisphaerae bacterium]
MQYAVIMAGGAGKRLWPLSRAKNPKQIINAFDGKSLLQLCVERIKDIFDANHIFIITNEEYIDEIYKHLPEIPRGNIIGEPIRRNTSNAIGLAATVLLKMDPDAVMAVFSADQTIEPVEPLQEAIRRALFFLETNPKALVTLGIKATSAHTGYGYLKRAKQETQNGIYQVEAFEEKPNKSTARKYFRSKDYCWNSGIFLWRADTIMQQLERFLPHNYERLTHIGNYWGTDRQNDVLNEEFRELQRISIDFGVIEHAVKEFNNVYMYEMECQWLDVGSYQTLADTIGKIDREGNVATNNTICLLHGSENNIVISDDPGHLIMGIHVEDMIIVHTDDATLICHREETDEIKEMLKLLKERDLGHFA